MHSGTLERAGSPRKRTLSRGVSEDESLRNIIKEQSEEDQELMELPEMNDLQASYDDVLQELRGLELQRETLLFQVDVLQDALEGAEEMLAEAQREASHATMELEREKEAKRKLEDIVSSLMQEVERLKEERNTISAVPVYTLVKEQEREDEMARQQAQEMKIKKEAQEQIRDAPRDEDNSRQDAPLSIIRLDSESLGPNNGLSSETSTGGLLASFFKKGRREQPSDSPTRPSPLHVARLVSSEDVADGAQDSFTKFTKIVNKTFGPLALGSQTPGSNQEENGRDLSPDRNNDTDSISAYEDACADMPELEEGDGPRLPHDEGSPVDDEGDPSNGNELKSIKNPNESCILS
ncbi:leucine-rich repeat flightless-interacting protein 2-like isoform X2 [Salvelinus fontinalis]|uniref:Leucine-rich repeat flightless-interacting protein 2 isoform X2 n=1 Tax=Salvelinus namaycush TaxID=8040 RepID=A0A8U1F1I1_SALNM|nr:leucine-rich repeat flightless-interacting protein 2 isoform X2 [Salvelinus namaycush]XP_055769929.1 leucine-rich repeat flightless-interacting protein 2-like isoform X2 [Salvelinus fontinalis]